MIFVDKRTGSADLQPLLKTKAVLASLRFGDVAFMGNEKDNYFMIGVERKNIRDLVNSISTGRLSGHQLPGMIKEFDRCYLIVEGIWKAAKITGELLVSRDYGKSYWALRGGQKWTVAGVQHYLTSMETFMGVSYRLTRDARDTAKTIDTLYQWWQNIQRHSSHLEAHKKTAKNIGSVDGVVTFGESLAGINKDVRNFALQLPGIDTKVSIDVARTFKTVREMFEADESKWRSIPHIGAATTREVMRILHG